MFRRFLLTFLLVVVGFVAGMVVTGRMRIATDSLASTSPVPAPVVEPQRGTAPAQAVAAPVSVGPDFTRIAGQAVKGVANISSLQVVRSRNSPFANDPFFNYFFGDSEQFGARDRRSLSLGSGVVISADGYVITNSHVVGENVREITIALPDKREIKGKVIGTDPSTDIALLKIPVAGLAIVPWGDSTQLKVGGGGVALAAETGAFPDSAGSASRTGAAVSACSALAACASSMPALPRPQCHHVRMSRKSASSAPWRVVFRSSSQGHCREVAVGLTRHQPRAHASSVKKNVAP